MDVDSDSEAEQAAREFAQAQERLRIANEARERRREERKRLMEESAMGSRKRGGRVAGDGVAIQLQVVPEFFGI